MSTTCDVELLKGIVLGSDPIEVGGIFQNLVRTRMIVSDNARACLRNPSFRVNGTKEVLDLAKLRIGDLGLPNGGTWQEICERVARVGESGPCPYHLCPNEVGPRLRLQYTNQPIDEFLLIGMEPLISAKRDHLSIFCVTNRGGALSLCGINFPRSKHFEHDRNIVLVRRQT